jgi:antitoxin MazE
MVTKVQKWGNSQGLRFPKSVIEEAGIKIGDEVRITVQEGKIIVEPLQRVRGKYRIEDLVAQIPGDYEAEEVDWGEPIGKEVW